MNIVMSIVQIILALAIITLVFLQATGENEGRSNLLTTPGEKRGWDKVMFNSTIVVIVLFLLSSLAQTLLL